MATLNDVLGETEEKRKKDKKRKKARATLIGVLIGTRKATAIVTDVLIERRKARATLIAVLIGHLETKRYLTSPAPLAVD